MRLDAIKVSVIDHGKPTIVIVAFPGFCAFPLVFVVSPPLKYSIRS
jgi:hypothetical protein